ncbi:putative ribonuclease H-like domain-containing protein [Tanacetum coccineum]|uniref:Ribonuclease H-like domain-containing protein n=1 Tax=Tanacetum coccineum TaxID=301880 RepID=A0ABQ4XHG3_9ASTR
MARSGMDSKMAKTCYHSHSVVTKSKQVLVNAAKQSSPRAATSISTARPVNTADTKPKVNNVTTVGPKAVVSTAEGNGETDVKSLACWIWRPTGNVIDHNSKYSGHTCLKDLTMLIYKADSSHGCSRHMTGNKSFLTDYQEIDGGFVAFGGSPKGGKITGKGKIRTRKLDFKDTECLVLSPDFKLLDESQVLLKVPRQNNMYSFDLKNVVPLGGLTCLFAKATIDESNLWHRRLGHINFKTMNKLVRGNLVRGLPSKLFENDHTCVACQKGKFSWVFFLATKDETSRILKTFITGIENQINHKVKIIRCDNGTEFKNNDMNQFCGMKGIKREFSVARTPQQNGVAERKNRTLIEAARTMLADSLLPTTFWAEAVNTACYVQNRVLVTKPHNKTPYELLHGRPPSISFMRPFGCPVTILNTLDPLGKFDGKADEGFLVGYSINSKAFRVFNTRTRKVEENLHITFLENKPNVAGSGPDWLFDIDLLTNSMNYEPVTAGNQTNKNAGIKDNVDAVPTQQYILLPLLYDSPQSSKDAVADDAGKKTNEEPANEGERNGQEKEGGASNKEGDQNVQDFRAELDNLLVQQKEDAFPTDPPQPDLEDNRDDGIFISQDKYVADILKKFNFVTMKTASTPIETNKALLKDEEAEDVDVHLYKSMIGSLMYLTASRPDIMFVVCACARDSPLDLEAFSDSDYVGASLDRKSTTEGFGAALGQKLVLARQKLVQARAKFVDQHNMVACLERTEENAEFNQIVDFLTTSSIHYALTLSPTIYASYIEQFWNTVNSQTVNDVKQIHATFDGKTVVISESSVRSDLHFNDDDGITCLTNTAIFENLALMGVFTNMKRKGKDFSERVTPLFASMLAPLVVGGEGSGQPSEPQPPSSTTQPIMKNKSLLLVPIPNVADEAIFKERDDRVVRATTTADSLDAAQASDRPRCQEAIGGAIDQTRSERASKHSYDSPLLGVNTPGSDEERNEQQDLMDFVPPKPYESPLSEVQTPVMVLALEHSKTAQDLDKALPDFWGTYRRKGLDKENVSKQWRKSDKIKPMHKDIDFDVLDDAMENVEDGSTAEQITTARDTLNTASINVSVVGPSTSTTGDIFEDEMITIADTLVAIRSARPRTTSVMIHNVEEEPRRATPFEREQRIARVRATKQEAKDVALIEKMEDVQERMDANELLAARLQEQEREQFSVDEQARFLVETITARKKIFAAQGAAEIRNRSPTRTQLRNQMITYLKHMGKYTHNQLKRKSFEEVQKLYKKEQQWINDFCQETKLQDDAEKEELRAFLDIVQGDDIAIDVESLATKYPIVDWKTHMFT